MGADNLDPNLTGEDLARLAAERPDLHADITAHPQVYPDLTEWIAIYGSQAPGHHVSSHPEHDLGVEPSSAPAPDSTSSNVGEHPHPLGTPSGGQRQKKQWWIAAGVALSVAVVVVIVGVSNSQEPSLSASPFGNDATDTAPVETFAPEPTDETPQSNEFPETSFDSSVTWTFENPQEFSYDMTISLSEIRGGDDLVGSSHPLNPDLRVGEACSYDPATDAVIAGKLVVVATTEGFDTPISTSYSFNPLGSDTDQGQHGDGRIEVEQGFSGGSDCEYLSSVNYGVEDARVKWSEPIPPGESRQHEFFLIAKDYYSPRAPDGDMEWLDSVSVVPNFGGSNTSESARQEIYQPDRSSVLGMTLSGRVISSVS